MSSRLKTGDGCARLMAVVRDATPCAPRDVIQHTVPDVDVGLWEAILPLPCVIPGLPSRCLGLWPSILDGESVLSIHAFLLHGNPVEVAHVPRARAVAVPEFLTRVAHALILLHQDALPVVPLLPPK